MFRRHSWIWASVLLILFALAVAPCDACPTCRQGMADGNHENMVRGYFWSIIFMMSMPFLIFGGLGTYFYLQVRRARSAQAAGVSASVVFDDSSSLTLSSQRSEELEPVGQQTTHV